MHPIQQHLFETNFRGLSGTRIEGTLALSEELINLGILDLLQGLRATSPPPTADVPSAKATAPAGPDPQALLQILQVDTLQIRAEKGKVLVDVKAGI